jgi:hypothetical protein
VSLSLPGAPLSVFVQSSRMKSARMPKIQVMVFEARRIEGRPPSQEFRSVSAASRISIESKIGQIR